jgi:hypothetical protein
MLPDASELAKKHHPHMSEIGLGRIIELNMVAYAGLLCTSILSCHTMGEVKAALKHAMDEGSKAEAAIAELNASQKLHAGRGSSRRKKVT